MCPAQKAPDVKCNMDIFNLGIPGRNYTLHSFCEK